MGNDATCLVIGIFFRVKQLLGFGTMKIKMFDEVVRVFSNVRHVPNLKKNLISLEVLDDLGYS